MFDEASATVEQQHALTVARQRIEYLRRLYGVATDNLGLTDNPEACQRGREIYHQIFTPDASLQAGEVDNPFVAVGPDAWAQVVMGALETFQTTQHLIGTQVVQFSDVQFDGDAIITGEASMTSYLHAWHEYADGRMHLVLGTYYDEVRYSSTAGWQIHAMNLVHNTSEDRTLKKA